MLTIATVLDPFSESCFAPDCNLIRLRSDDYLSRLNKSGKIDLLLVESVWRGPGNTWSHYLVNNRKHPIPTGFNILKKLINECHRKHIPTVFWAKEDPVHLKHFIVSASLFDYVATTDSDCVPIYKNKLKHNRVFALPFAAQPKIHSPSELSNRNNLICFAGTCRNKQYPNRKAAMDIILPPAIKHGLHIYDRHQAGASGEPFPNMFKSCVLGGLTYEETIKKYKEYRVFLNVNSIDKSPTMFSWRVFELLSCGTPVISSYSIGIEKILPEVLLSRSPEQTERHIINLMNDTYWKKVSDSGMKRIFSAHTYAHRIKTICKFIKVG